MVRRQAGEADSTSRTHGNTSAPTPPPAVDAGKAGRMYPWTSCVTGPRHTQCPPDMHTPTDICAHPPACGRHHTRRHTEQTRHLQRGRGRTILTPGCLWPQICSGAPQPPPPKTSQSRYPPTNRAAPAQHTTLGTPTPPCMHMPKPQRTHFCVVKGCMEQMHGSGQRGKAIWPTGSVSQR